MFDVFFRLSSSVVSENFIVFIKKFGPQLSDSNQVIMHNLNQLWEPGEEREVDNSHHLLTPTKFWENSRKISRQVLKFWSSNFEKLDTSF